MRDIDDKKLCLHYLEHPCLSFQVIGAVTRFYYLRDAEKNRVSHPRVPGVVCNPVVSSSKLLFSICTQVFTSKM